MPLFARGGTWIKESPLSIKWNSTTMDPFDNGRPLRPLNMTPLEIKVHHHPLYHSDMFILLLLLPSVDSRWYYTRTCPYFQSKIKSDAPNKSLNSTPGDHRKRIIGIWHCCCWVEDAKHPTRATSLEWKWDEGYAGPERSERMTRRRIKIQWNDHVKFYCVYCEGLGHPSGLYYVHTLSS